MRELKEALAGAPKQLLPGATGDADKIALYFSPIFITPDVLLGRKARAAAARSGAHRFAGRPHPSVPTLRR